MGSQHKKSAEDILADDNYQFRAGNVRGVFQNEKEYADFVRKYWAKVREKKENLIFNGRAPSPEDLALFYDYNDGKITFAEIRKAWGGVHVTSKLGKIFAWIHQQQKKEGDNAKPDKAGSRKSIDAGAGVKKGNGR